MKTTQYRYTEDELIERFKEHAAQGWSNTSFGRGLEVSQNTVSTWRRRKYKRLDAMMKEYGAKVQAQRDNYRRTVKNA